MTIKTEGALYRPARGTEKAFSPARSPIRWIMRDDVTGLYIPAGSNPGSGLNNLFVMNINSGKLIRIAAILIPRAYPRKAMKNEGKRGLKMIANYETGSFTSYDIHPMCLFPLLLSLSLPLHLIFLYFPNFLAFTLAAARRRIVLSISRLRRLRSSDHARVIGMPEA